MLFRSVSQSRYEKVGGSTDIKDRAIVGKVEKFGGRVDGFHRSLELAHVGVVDPEIRVESHEVTHLGTRLASGEPRGKQGKEQKNACHGLFCFRRGMRGVDQFPEAGIFRKRFILGARQLGTEGKILEGVFVEDPVNHQAGGFLFEVDPVVPGPVSVEGAIRAFHRAEAIGMTGKKVGGQNVELAEDLHLQGGGKLADLGGAGRAEDDLEGRHAEKFKFKLRFK